VLRTLGDRVGGNRGWISQINAIGVSETDANIRNKISRGGFSAVFFVQCLVAIGAHTIRLHEAD
jgi:hypothetical protein